MKLASGGDNEFGGKDTNCKKSFKRKIYRVRSAKIFPKDPKSRMMATCDWAAQGTPFVNDN
jgi:hypothetical protein